MLSTALWDGAHGGSGRASVMVGSGMSLNTVPAIPSPRPMLTWSQLTDRLVNRMHPPVPANEDARRRAHQACAAPGGFLRVAEEFEAALGRAALDSLLIDAVPDADHGPGPLHDLLLRLPWRDVLTTNYDTLLERAAARVHGQVYSVVATAPDIGISARPRIVKLHGSLPFVRPFVLTEEDFRTYPQRSPAFVSLARQAILETTLCLVGFSGDDPNFLQWSGWVRDVLGSSAQRIYLCGILDLTSAQATLLRGRNVIPIDLSPVFPANDYPVSSVRRARALEWFLVALTERRPPNRLTWPLEDPAPSVATSPGLPDRPASPVKRLAAETRFP